jgi:hypothetical protein
MSEQICERLSLLEEAHRGHRAQLAELSAKVSRLASEIGCDLSAPRLAGRGDLQGRVSRLENGGLNWTTSDATKALAQLRQLRDAFDDIFAEES